jgi:hypothetical protein
MVEEMDVFATASSRQDGAHSSESDETGTSPAVPPLSLNQPSPALQSGSAPKDQMSSPGARVCVSSVSSTELTAVRGHAGLLARGLCGGVHEPTPPS